MKLLSELLSAAFHELGDCGVLDWFPDDNAPETFIAEAVIEHSGPVATLTLCGHYVFLCYDVWDRAWRDTHAMPVDQSE